jgi:predicted nucleic acid-binding protein
MNSDITRARKIYIDANIIIYFIEGAAVFRESVIELFRHTEEHNIPIMTSEISIGECLYGAYKRKNEAIADKYREIFHEIGMFHLIPVEQEIAERAAKVGAENGLKLIDAIHFTSALDVGCKVFVTNDRGIKSAEGLKVVQLFEAIQPLTL